MAYEITTIGDMAPMPPVGEVVIGVVRNERRGLVVGALVGIVLGFVLAKKLSRR